MQIILDKDEVIVIHEALLTELRELKEELEIEKRKGYGEFIESSINEVEALIKRFEPYVGIKK